MTTQIIAAKNLAFGAHAGFKRKYTGERYFNHVDRVAKMLDAWNFHPRTVVVGYLHDIIEDTNVTYSDISWLFGTEIADGVHFLTNPIKTDSCNRECRHVQNMARLASIPAWVQNVKIADLLDNTTDIVKHNKKFAKVYLREKQEILDVLDKAHSEFREQAQQELEHLREELYGNEVITS